MNILFVEKMLWILTGRGITTKMMLIPNSFYNRVIVKLIIIQIIISGVN